MQDRLDALQAIYDEEHAAAIQLDPNVLMGGRLFPTGVNGKRARTRRRHGRSRVVLCDTLVSP